MICRSMLKKIVLIFENSKNNFNLKFSPEHGSDNECDNKTNTRFNICKHLCFQDKNNYAKFF